MKQFFRELLEYNYHFNQELGDVFVNETSKMSEKSIKLYSHILNAHNIWNSRIEYSQTNFGVWDIHPVEACRDIDKQNYEDSLRILDKYDLDLIIDYTTTRGDKFSNRLRDILFHIINHGTYHRGQIATEFRQSGLAPLVSDFVLYKR